MAAHDEFVPPTSRYIDRQPFARRTEPSAEQFTYGSHADGTDRKRRIGRPHIQRLRKQRLFAVEAAAACRLRHPCRHHLRLYPVFYRRTYRNQSTHAGDLAGAGGKAERLCGHVSLAIWLHAHHSAAHSRLRHGVHLPAADGALPSAVRRQRFAIILYQYLLSARPSSLPAAYRSRHAHPPAQHPPPPSNCCGGEMRQKRKPRREGGKALYAERKARKTENTPAANAAGVPFHTTTLGQEKIL